MSEESVPNISTLKSLSVALENDIQHAKIEARRANEQLEALAHAKIIVDESIKLLVGATEHRVQFAAGTTVFPSGSLAIPLAEQFLSLPAGAPRSNVCSQIYSTVYTGASAFVDLVDSAGTDAHTQVQLLRQKLADHREEILSLETRLTTRLATYSEHLVRILEGALASFRDPANPTRFTNTGNGLRELLREFLAVAAPDKEVRKAPWFVSDPTSKTGVTRLHRMEYAIYQNLKKADFHQSFAKQADDSASALLKEIDRLSAYTHVTEKILAKENSEAAPLFASVLQRFLLLIAAIESAQVLVKEDISQEIQDRLESVFTQDFFSELDTLSSHTRPRGVSDLKLTKIGFSEDTIIFSGSGVVECDLQYGSDGDVRRGDGVEWHDSFPFTFEGSAPISDPSAAEVDRDSISVDTSSFYDDGSEEA